MGVTADKFLGAEHQRVRKEAYNPTRPELLNITSRITMKPHHINFHQQRRSLNNEDNKSLF